MTIRSSMVNIKYLLENFDQPTVRCPACGTYTVDHGGVVVDCRACDYNLVYREPVKEVCPRCMQKVPLVHACPGVDNE